MWLILSFTSAIVQGLQNTYYKKAEIQINPILVAWSVLVISAILLSPLLIFFNAPSLNKVFWIAVGVRLIIDSIAFPLYVSGIQKSPLHLTIPMLSLMPLLSLISVFLINHIFPSFLGLLGLITTVIGIYFLNFDQNTKHIFSPFKAIYKEKGVRYITIVAVLWSIVISLQKLGVDNSNFWFYTAFFQIIWAIFFTPIVYILDKKGFVSLFRPKLIKQLSPAGIFDVINIMSHNGALVFGNPSFVSAVGNTSILFSTFFGWYFLKEKVKKRVIPILLIVVGIIIISLT